MPFVCIHPPIHDPGYRAQKNRGTQPASLPPQGRRLGRDAGRLGTEHVAVMEQSADGVSGFIKKKK